MSVTEIIKGAEVYAAGCRVLAGLAPEGSKARKRLTYRAKVMHGQLMLLKCCYNDVERVKMIHRFAEP